MAEKYTINKEMAVLRGRLGGYRSRAQDDPELVATKTLLAQKAFIARFERLLAEHPSLTKEQKEKLATVLEEKVVV